MVIDVKENRYVNRCSCEQLRRRPLTLNIISIIKESNKKWITIKDIIKIGREKYRDWPKDRNTVFRALKTMSKCHFVNEKKRGQGQTTLWSLNTKEISSKDLIIHEVKQLEQVISRLPQSMFEVDYIMVEINHIWQRIRTALIDVEKLDVAMNWILFGLKEKELFKSSSFSTLDKQLSIIFLFCIFNPSQKLLDRWFDLSRVPYSVKVDFELAKIFKNHFYPKKTKEKLIEKLNNHKIDPELSKKLEFFIIIYLGTMKLDYKYRYQIFDKNKFSYLGTKELEKHSKTIDMEKDKLYLEWDKRKIFFLEIAKKREYKPEEIDLFIDDYKDILTPSKN